jgi:Flp pilus assembly pilin Flp
LHRAKPQALANDARGISAAEHGILGAAIIGALSFLAPQFGGQLMPIFDKIIDVVQRALS